MIIWLNGPFGVGKTSAAEALAAKSSDWIVVNPETLGDALWSYLPKTSRAVEFELQPGWCEMVRHTISSLDRYYDYRLIVPMTIAYEASYDETIVWLRRQGHDVRHFSLLASREVIAARLAERMKVKNEPSDEWGELSWEGLQIERCLRSLRDPRFGVHIETDQKSAAAVADLIISCLPD